MMTDAELIQAARNGLLMEGGEGFISLYFLDGAPLDFQDSESVDRLFRDKVFTFDDDEVNQMPEVVPVRVRPGVPR